MHLEREIAVWQRRIQALQAEISHLRQSEEKFRLAFQTSPDSISFSRLSDGMLIDINESFTRLTGYTREEAIGKTSTDLKIWADPLDRDRMVNDLLSKESAENLEARFRRKDGKIGTGLMSARVLRLNQEDLILSITRDITKRKQVENALRESENRYHQFLQATTDAVLVRSGEIITDANPTALKLLRANHLSQLIGKSYLDFVHPEDRAESAARLIKSMDGNWMAPPREHRLMRLDGQVIHVESTGVPIRYQGQVQHFGMFRDITDRRRADQQREKLEAQLRQAQKMEAIGTLAGGIAHDFNNILAVIVGNAQLLEMTNLSFSGSDEIRQILNASKRAKQLVRQILAFSRQSEQEKLLISLKPLVKETLEFLRSSLPATIQVQHSIKGDLGAVMADPTQMQQVIMNLCTNAAHAMERGGGILKIELKPMRLVGEAAQLDFGADPGDYVCLTVSDTGHGIEPDLISRIFDPYFTTKGPEKGTGLGLSVVHGIVKSHHGGIKVTSRVDKGTIFQILLPRADGIEKTEKKTAQKLPTGVERILAVDDEKQLVEVYERMLGQLGYRVETLTDPAEALDAVRGDPQKYDLVITDMTMPQMTGYSLTKKLKEIRPELPVILCTGFNDQVDEEQVHSLGLGALLLKPVLFNDLATTLRRVLDATKK